MFLKNVYLTNILLNIKIKDLPSPPLYHKCNFEFLQFEYELKDLIGIANENTDLQKGITDSSVKSILDQPNSESRLKKSPMVWFAV